MPVKAKPESRRIAYLPLAELRGDARNPRTHDETTIGASVDRFGYLEPIIRDERTGLIVSGHGRKKVLEDMRARGDAAPPEGCRVDSASGEWLVPVVVGWASKSDNEAAGALIALNRTTERGGWVDDALLELLDELDTTDDGLAGIGFSQEDRDAIERLRDATGVFDADDYDVDEALDELGNENVDAFKRVIINCVDEPAYHRLAAFITADGSTEHVRKGVSTFWFGADRPRGLEPKLAAGSPGAFDAPAG
jgi:hypothetical protein